MSMSRRMFLAAVAVFSVIVFVALSAAFPISAQTNSAPEFPPGTATRSVNENSPAFDNIGGPVTATDSDDSRLVYTLGKRPHVPIHHRQGHRSIAGRRTPGLRDHALLHGQGKRYRPGRG